MFLKTRNFSKVRNFGFYPAGCSDWVMKKKKKKRKKKRERERERAALKRERERERSGSE